MKKQSKRRALAGGLHLSRLGSYLNLLLLSTRKRRHQAVVAARKKASAVKKEKKEASTYTCHGKIPTKELERNKKTMRSR